ncbi:hypothetical protein [Rubeoparvulum massiliense]|uniref:hypothetical protein n=1 Tax=Rubeoparvulum massiliense TaxID=1631346 RepID=UPI0011C8BEB6|nr:hypothetical protein [Rubeoparvulum massiliense]
MKMTGNYAIYNNKEYEANKDGETFEIVLITKDKHEKRNGFKKSKWADHFLKRVTIHQLQYAYRHQNYGLYRGERVVIFDKKGDCFWIAADAETAKKVGIPRSDKFSYEALVNKSDIDEVFYEKKPIWGFEKKDEPLNLE